jgi:hypothetical protein
MALKKAATFSRAFQNVNGGVGPMSPPLLLFTELSARSTTPVRQTPRNYLN